jgi:hypothetical protein
LIRRGGFPLAALVLSLSACVSSPPPPPPPQPRVEALPPAPVIGVLAGAFTLDRPVPPG